MKTSSPYAFALALLLSFVHRCSRGHTCRSAIFQFARRRSGSRDSLREYRSRFKNFDRLR